MVSEVKKVVEAMRVVWLESGEFSDIYGFFSEFFVDVWWRQWGIRWFRGWWLREFTAGVGNRGPGER